MYSEDLQSYSRDVFVTYTVGEFKKLVGKHWSSHVRCHYQVNPEPVNMNAAHIPRQDL
jgi:hypothetical protein